MVKPIVSVIVPVYNTEKYILKCLTSLKKQTFSNIEILVIDDCGNDDAIKLARHLTENDNRVRIITHNHNRGPGGARNSGIFSASGEYLFFLDSDDCIPIDALQVLVNKAISSGSDMILANMATEYNGILTMVEYIETAIKSIFQPDDANNIKISTNFFYTGSTVNRLYKRRLLVDKNLRFIENTYWEDMQFSLEVWYAAEKITVIPNIVYFRTIREDPMNLSITQVCNQKSFTDRDIILEYIYKWAEVRHSEKNAVLLADRILARMFHTTKNMVEKNTNSDLYGFLLNWFDTHQIRYRERSKQLQGFL